MSDSAYPLRWPPGWRRTPHASRHAPYSVSFTRARDDLLRSLRLMGARNVTISSNLPLRQDGLPYANCAEPTDPGVAVYWSVRDGAGALVPKVMACDKWKRVRENMRAIGLALEGLRAIERSGASQIFERAYDGFAALPPEAGPDGAAWWAELEVEPDAPIEVIERAYKRLARVRHPDAAEGSHERFVALNDAVRRARAERGKSG